MKTARIFDSFARRSQMSGEVIEELPAQFRYRVMTFCKKAFPDNPPSYDRTGSRYFWSEIRQQLERLFGRQIGWVIQYDAFRVLRFLENCTSAEFLDFMELIFKVDYIWRLRNNYWKLIDDFNECFKFDDIPYFMTDFYDNTGFYARGAAPLKANVHPKITAYPRITRRDSGTMHEIAIQPALKLLQDPRFETANQEFLEALLHHRDGDYGDSVLKCQNSFESVMKIICEQKEWSYKRHDTLLIEVIERSSIPPFFKNPLGLMATIRNELGKSHGAGTESREISPHVAQYTINATASAILLLVAETRP